MMLAINEIFETIQGEAKFTGTPSIFVRLQFCDVGCPWCDTKHTWELVDMDGYHFDEMLAKTKDSSNYALKTERDLFEYLKTKTIDHIVFTGGEPCFYDLTEITTALINIGKSVQIETSGTYEIKCHPNTWVTLSPKVDMKGKKEVLASSLLRANEIKMPVGKQKDIEVLRSLEIKNKTIWLQPLSQNKKATNICVDQAIKNNWNVSIQTHKYMEIR